MKGWHQVVRLGCGRRAFLQLLSRLLIGTRVHTIRAIRVEQGVSSPAWSTVREYKLNLICYLILVTVHRLKFGQYCTLLS